MKLIYGAALALCLSVSTASAASLADLSAGSTLTIGDVVFSNFSFSDKSLLPDDLVVDAAEIEVTASAPTATSASLTFLFDPALALSDVEKVFFEAWIDFDVAVSGSSRTLSFLTLSAGSDQIDATVDAFSEVVFSVGSLAGPLVEIFDNVNPFDGIDLKQTTDGIALGGVASTSLFGAAQGEVFGAGATALLSGFTLTFELTGEPPTVVPLPASLPFLAAGLFTLGMLRRRGRIH